MFMGTIKNKSDYTFEKFDFRLLVNYLEQQREERKNLTVEQKNEKKQIKDKKDEYYGLALIDNFTEKMGGYTIEAPTQFKGRGDHPKAGFLKPRIKPEQHLYLYVWAIYFIIRNIYNLIFNLEINFNSGFFVNFLKFLPKGCIL